MKILFLDSYYENVIEHLMGLPRAPEPDAEPCVKTRWLNEQCHGTADYWERAVNALGHEAWTVVVNAPWFQHDNQPEEIDVAVFQNVADRKLINVTAAKKVAFCSYAASDDDLRGWDAVFTSFPHQVNRIQGLSPCHYLQLAFDPVAVERVMELRPKVSTFWGDSPATVPRDLWLTFVGGLG